ncbi:hypothetical protein AB0B50_30355 [Streptomyces sp. NPDC041068]|uniref:hypothetical protein n=1 Tax=Streptomyces sp. NPDC041068 TaxID=3155130 RepID=UPI00340C1D0F
MPMDPYAALHALLRAEAVRTAPADTDQKPETAPHHEHAHTQHPNRTRTQNQPQNQPQSRTRPKED